MKDILLKIEDGQPIYMSDVYPTLEFDEYEEYDDILQAIKENVKLTVQEVKDIALERYQQGGDVIVECWTDRDIEEWITQEGDYAQLLCTFSLYKSMEGRF